MRADRFDQKGFLREGSVRSWRRVGCLGGEGLIIFLIDGVNRASDFAAGRA